MPTRVALQRERDAGGRESLTLGDHRARWHHLVVLAGDERERCAVQTHRPRRYVELGRDPTGPEYDLVGAQLARLQPPAYRRRPLRESQHDDARSRAREMTSDLRGELLQVRDVVGDLRQPVL